MQDPQIHWFSILNSFMIVIFLSGMVAMILMRALHKDLRRYNADPEELEQAQEETGWKLVHGDVFRTPSNPSLFACVIGTGVQVLLLYANMRQLYLYIIYIGICNVSINTGICCIRFFISSKSWFINDNIIIIICIYGNICRLF